MLLYNWPIYVKKKKTKTKTKTKKPSSGIELYQFEILFVDFESTIAITIAMLDFVVPVRLYENPLHCKK